MTNGRPRVLYVDDENQPRLLLKRLVGQQFDVVTASGGAEGLELLAAEPSMPIVISDFDMPKMNGAAFLSQVRERFPDATRLLLTGNADIEGAVAAVNDGQIFRFLTKPCEYPQLVAALDAALAQHRLVTGERILLEQTLHGSIKVLTEMLSLVNPTAFGRATRIRRYAAELAKFSGIASAWQVEVAAMLSQISCVTLPPSTVEKLYRGQPLTDSEQPAVDRLPDIADGLLANIPRLEDVRAILRHHDRRFDGSAGPVGAPRGLALPVGARVLKITLDFDVLEARGNSVPVVLDTMRGRTGWYDPELFEAFVTLRERIADPSEVHEIQVEAVTAGMVFVEDVRTAEGVLVLSKGYRVTEGLVERIRNFPVTEKVRVTIPKTPPA